VLFELQFFEVFDLLLTELFQGEYYLLLYDNAPDFKSTIICGDYLALGGLPFGEERASGKLFAAQHHYCFRQPPHYQPRPL
jgi:hypothetical protein